MDGLTTLGLNYVNCPNCGQKGLPQTGPCVHCGHRIPGGGGNYAACPGCGQMGLPRTGSCVRCGYSPTATGAADSPQQGNPGYASNPGRPPGPGSPSGPGYAAGPYTGQPAGYVQRMCRQHRTVPAMWTCMVCHSPICQTCDFDFGGNAHVCPRCIATKDNKGLTGKRKLFIGAGFGIAIWGTLGLVLLFSGALSGAFKEKSEQEALGYAIYLLLFIPSLIGMGLSIASFERRLPNPASLWIAALWNGLIFAGLLILIVVGLLAKA